MKDIERFKKEENYGTKGKKKKNKKSKDILIKQ
jgi:hypothetical protein